MPKLVRQCDTIEEQYDESKTLRSSATNKRLRRLRAFERIHYKKTCEVKKTGHNLVAEHRLDDGNLRYSTRNLTYSLNKKKRWLLPDIIEQRICEHEPTSETTSKTKQGKQDSTIDERLKIVMYENENIHHSSTCIRYGNSQTKPHVLHKNGGRFNSTTLTKWIDFDTRPHGNSRHRNRNDNIDRVNQPNFGIEKRPGFFPSEVTYEFLYPKRLSSSDDHRRSKTSLSYTKGPHNDDLRGRSHRDTNKNRRTVRKTECTRYNSIEQDYDFEEDIDDNEFVNTSWDMMDENEKWSIVLEESDDQSCPRINFPINYFIPFISFDRQSSTHSDNNLLDIITDHKAHKYFEPPIISNENIATPSIITEDLLCSIPCESESNFLSSMQQSTMKISQANLSPPIFIQKISSTSFSVVYTYCRASSTINATLKFSDIRPILMFKQNEITLDGLIELISKKLDEYRTNGINKPTLDTRINVDALRGSLPLPITILQNMLIVKPNSTDKQTALRVENVNNDSEEQEQWFDTINNECKIVECSICCETLTDNDTYQLLPCCHTLCHACLTSYVRTSISTATYSSSSISPITCFQPNCSTQLNSTLLQAFVSYDIYQSYHQSLIDRHLFSTGHYRKCPSRACSKLLIVDDNNKPSLMCSCGQRVCSKCLEEYHFPATCEQYKSYVTRLRESGDDLLSASTIGENSSCYIAEGKNCPNCGEFVEKNGGCPHMTCKCGSEYCWMCLKQWASHSSYTCFSIPELTHELRSSTRNRLHNKAINHRRQRNQYSFSLLEKTVRKSKICFPHYDKLLSTYIDLNTLAEFVYVLLQRRRTDVNIRAVLGRTASRLELDAFRIKLQIECEQIKMNHVEKIRLRLEQTISNLIHMKKNKVLV